MIPIITQNTLRMEYARSFFNIEHHDSITASVVLKTQTNKKGLDGPSQLTRLKLDIRMMTPINSMTRMCFRMNAFTAIRHSVRGIEETAERKVQPPRLLDFFLVPKLCLATRFREAPLRVSIAASRTRAGCPGSRDRADGFPSRSLATTRNARRCKFQSNTPRKPHAI